MGNILGHITNNQNSNNKYDIAAPLLFFHNHLSLLNDIQYQIPYGPYSFKNTNQFTNDYSSAVLTIFQLHCTKKTYYIPSILKYNNNNNNNIKINE